MSIQRVSTYAKHAGSTSSIAFAAPQGPQTQGFDHLIRHVVERVLVYRKTGHVRPALVARVNRGERNVQILPGRITGKVNRKVDPFPGSDSTHMRPPWNSTIFLHVARPIPVPIGLAEFSTL